MNVTNGVKGGELDLNLGLSIGGVFKGTAIEKAIVDVKMKTGDFVIRSEIPPVFKSDGKGEMTIDILRKREIHALRRQEAKKKREEKQQQRNLSSFSNGKNKICSTDDKVRLQAQEFKCRVVDRGAKEKEMNASNGLNSKIGENGAYSTDSEGKALNLGPNPVSNANLNCVSCQTTKRNCENIASSVHSESKSPNSQQNVIPTRKSNPKPKPHGNQTVCPDSSCTMMPVQYPFHPLQYIPFTLPYLMPYWSSASSPILPSDSKVNQDNSVCQPVPCKSFRPFASSNPNPKENPKRQASLDSANDEGNSRKTCLMKQCHSSHASTGSLCTSSSALSDHQSSSNQGGSTGETRSHSIGSPSPQSQIEDCPKQEHFKDNNLSQKIEQAGYRCVAISVQSNPQKIEDSLNNTDRPSKEEHKSIPPNACLPQMPCVSTTGNGPNGKTITGFLYRYTKTEVSIVCVCHGSSFTPVEFIKHAGGTDIRHPLKHIVVVPSSFG